MVDHEHFMALAIAEARKGAALGEQPFGALIALDGEVIVKTPSLKVSSSDTTRHSETFAIALATQKLKMRTLPPGAVFYATCEPCPMCAGAILNGGIKTLVLGARNATVRQFSSSAFQFNDYSVEAFAKLTGWDLTVIQGVREDECVALYREAAVELTR
jgi:tRNA(adenine34) deaminase